MSASREEQKGLAWAMLGSLLTAVGMLSWAIPGVSGSGEFGTSRVLVPLTLGSISTLVFVMQLSLYARNRRRK